MEKEKYGHTTTCRRNHEKLFASQTRQPNIDSPATGWSGTNAVAGKVRLQSDSSLAFWISPGRQALGGFYPSALALISSFAARVFGAELPEPAYRDAFYLPADSLLEDERTRTLCRDVHREVYRTASLTI